MANDLVELQANIRITRQVLMAKVSDWLSTQVRLPPLASAQQFLGIIQAKNSQNMLQRLNESGLSINRFDSYNQSESSNYLHRVYQCNEGSDRLLEKYCDILNAFELLFRMDELLTPIECNTNVNDLEWAVMMVQHAQLQAAKAPDRADICEKYRLQGVDALATYQDSLQCNQNILDATKMALDQRAMDMQDTLSKLVQLIRGAYAREPNTSYFARFFSSYWQLIWESTGTSLFKLSIYHDAAKDFERQAASMVTTIGQYLAEDMMKKQQELNEIDQKIQSHFNLFGPALQAKLSRSGVNEQLLLERPLADPAQQLLRDSNPLQIMSVLMRTGGFAFRFFPVAQATGLLRYRADLDEPLTQQLPYQ